MEGSPESPQPSSKPYHDLLPNEILARILDFGKPASLLWFSHVCRRFKEVVYEHPVFSGEASLHSLGTKPPTQGSFNLFLKQLSCSSNPVSVDLILTSLLTTQMIQELIEALANNLHRMTSLLLQIRMSSEAEVGMLVQALSRPAPEIRWFRFEAYTLIHPSDHDFHTNRVVTRVPSALFGGEAPQLRTVLLDFPPAEPIPAFSTVEHLLLVEDPVPQQLVNLRSDFPSLRRVDFWIYASLDYDPELVSLFSRLDITTIEEMTLRVHPVLPVLPVILGHLEDNGPITVSAIRGSPHMQPGHPGLFNFTVESVNTKRIRRFVDLDRNEVQGVAETFTRLGIDQRVTSLGVSAPDLDIAISLFPKLSDLKFFEVSLKRELFVETFYPPVLREEEFNPEEDHPDFDWTDPSIGRIECPNLEKVIIAGTGDLICSATWLAFLAGHVLGATARARIELELRGVQHIGDINDVLGGHFHSVTMRRAMPRRFKVQPRVVESPPHRHIASEDE